MTNEFEKIDDLVQIDKPEVKDRPNIRFQFFNRPPTDGEKYFQVSKTQPDQSMTVRELLERNKRGLPLTGQKFPIYLGDTDDMPNLKTMDLSEIADLRDKVQEDINEYRSQIATENKRIQEAEQRREELVRFEQWKQKEESKKPII